MDAKAMATLRSALLLASLPMARIRYGSRVKRDQKRDQKREGERIQRQQMQHGMPHVRAEADVRVLGEEHAAGDALMQTVVRRLDEAAIDLAVPGLRAQLEKASGKWGDHRRPRWLSNGCDIFSLVWYALYADEQPAFDHLWVLQHDVGWTGQLYPILSSAATPADDLVCVDHVAAQRATWTHVESRNTKHRHAYPGPVSSCLLPAVRYSRRLLVELLADLRNDVMTYCEARAATTCAHRSWCRLRDLRQTPSLLGLFTYYSLLNESRLHPLECPANLVGRLFHRIV